MPQIYRRLALAGLVILGGLCFSQLAPVTAAILLLPTTGPSMSDLPAGMTNHIHQLQRAGTAITGLWIAGMVLAAGGTLYGLITLAFGQASATPATSPSPPS